MREKAAIMCLCLALYLPVGAVAEEPGSRSEWVQRDPAKKPVNKASDSSFDKRLPPVFPGEVVGDSGTKMKVWSTSGPVPVAEAPEPWKTPALPGGRPDGIGDSGISVIVDDRKGTTRVPSR